ncbi:MAG: amino acid ABC transporter permease [Vulcanimicrobiaceae bacterium]
MGIRLTILYDGPDRARMEWGIVTTIELSVLTIAFSLVIGFVGAWLAGSPRPVVRRLLAGYIALFRNTPPLVQMYFFFFALNPLFPRITEGGLAHPLLNNYFWAIFSLSFFAGAFNVEIFRSGLEAVPKTMVEAAESLGYSRLESFRRVVLPLAFRISLPALANNLVNLVKTTSLAYAIAVPEMLYVANQIWSDEANVPEMMVFILIAYVVLVAILVRLLQALESRLRIPGYGV